ncbi:PREDICTED: tripartite motif-containing protein 3-like [Branchiostoma belcheri]|uniref:RING-type E3 ubiquitin transferase n=1 Tax=Branchiostoma belcheri TaxID=7741 RepID=A0A6P4ZXI0_BRABE|nr:PREDICTED: tripartite motif-containing protein 3-like [Branchiostoma belcheri]
MACGSVTDLDKKMGTEFLECQICLDDLKQPKMLPCLHTFCLPCLERVLEAEPDGKLSCPTCCQDVPLPKDGTRVFKNNFPEEKLQEAAQKPLKSVSFSTQEPETSCTACDTGSKSTYFCIDCTDYLCQVCTDAHDRMKIFQSHRVVTVRDLTSSKVADDLRTRETSKCPDHNEVNKFYCSTCLSVVCLHCVVVQHKDHDYLEIQEVAEKERAKLDEKLIAVQRQIEQREQWLEQAKPLQHAWQSQLQRCTDDINVQAERMVQAVAKVREEKIAQLQATSASREKQLSDAIDATEMELVASKSYVSFADKMLEYGSPSELLLATRELTDWLEEGPDEKSAIEQSKGLTRLRFDSPTNDLDEAVATLFGAIKQIRISLQPPCTTQVKPNKADSRKHRKARLTKATGTKGVNDLEFRCPLSLTTSIDDDIIVVDRDNERLQVLKKSGAFVGTVELTFQPQSVAALTNGELLVTGDKHNIQVVDKHGRPSRVIKVGGAIEKEEPTNGITVDRQGRIIVTIAYEIFALNLEGDITFKFGDKDSLGYVLWVTSNGSNQIVVSDELSHNVKVFDSSGRHLFSCVSQGEGNGQLCHPVSVITDSEDNIVVADNKNNRVCVFGKDGAFLRQVLTAEDHGITEPLGLTLTQEGLLVVSDRSYDNECIKIFRLS